MSSIESTNVTSMSFPDGALNIYDMDDLCRKSSCSEFSTNCAHLSYDQVYQVHSELLSRSSNITHQLKERGEYDQQWSARAKSARSILQQKINVASHRLDMIQRNHLSVLLEKIGGSGWLASKRLVMIKCLIHIIDHYCNIRNLSSEERSVLDLCRSVSGLTEESKFNELSYDPIQNSIISTDDGEIARISIGGSLSEEWGYLLSSSVTMLTIMERAEMLAEYVTTKTKCKENGEHEKTKCARCMSEELYKDITDLLSKIK
jgi:hypothetical protein